MYSLSGVRKCIPAVQSSLPSKVWRSAISSRAFATTPSSNSNSASASSWPASSNSSQAQTPQNGQPSSQNRSEEIKVNTSGNQRDNQLDSNSSHDRRNRDRGLQRRGQDFFDPLDFPFGSLGISRFDPFRELDRFNRSLFSDPFSFGRNGVPTRASTSEVFDWKPSADLIETKDGFELTAELPGVQKENVKIEIHDDVITLKGEKREVKREEKEGTYYKERSFGSFVRKFSLPDGVDPKSIKAEFNDGVLKLHLPKGGEAKKHEVQIQ